MVYQDYTSNFDELLKLNGSVTIHHRNIQLVAILMFKVKNGLCPEIMRDIFLFNKNWVPNCKCRLCKNYVAQVGFIETKSN